MTAVLCERIHGSAPIGAHGHGTSDTVAIVPARIRWLGLAACAVFLLPYALLSFYAVPVGDDYTYTGYRLSTSELVDTVKGYYQTLGGMYTSVALRYVHATSTGLSHYWIIPLASQLAILVGLLAVFGIWCKGILVPAERLFGAVLLYAVFMTQMPAPAEFIYWATGAIINVPGVLLYLVILACMQPVITRGELGWGRCLALVPLCAMAVTIHYIYLLSTVATLAIVTLRAFVSRSPARARLVAVLAVTIGSCLVVLAAPGNLGRVDDSGGAGSHLVRNALVATVGFRVLLQWLTSGMTIAVTLLAAAVLSQWSRPYRSSGHCTFWVLCVVIAYVAIFWCLGLFCALAGYRATHGRVLDVLYLLFLLLIPVSGAHFMLASGFGEFLAQFVARPAVRCLTIIFILFSLFGQGSFQTAVMDLASRAPDFKRQHEARNRAIESQRQSGANVVYVRALRQPPKVSYRATGELTEDPKHYSNRNMARLFGVQGIIARNEAPTGGH